MSPVVLLTGASKGLGLSTLSLLLSAPLSARVVCVSRSLSAELSSLAQSHPDNVELVQGDVALRETSKRAVNKAIERWGALDAVVLNAGSLEPLGRVAEVDVSAVESLFHTNLFSLLHTIQLALPSLRTSPTGSIVLVSSGAAETGYAGWGAYSATKAAMNSICRNLGVEETEVASIAIRPGVVDTDMQLNIRTNGGDHMSPDAFAKFTSLHTSGSLLPPAWPGHVLASLAAKGVPKELSGKFVQWDAADLAAHQNPNKTRE